MTRRFKNKKQKTKKQKKLFVYYSLWCILGCYRDGLLVEKLALLFIYLRKEKVKRIDAYGWVVVFRPEIKTSRRSKNCLRLPQVHNLRVYFLYKKISRKPSTDSSLAAEVQAKV